MRLEYSDPNPVPEVPVEASIAVGSGYGESKWVAEKILLLAGSETSLRPSIVRIAQVSGGLNGCWNPLEWIPSIVQSTTLVNCLPTLNQVGNNPPTHIQFAHVSSLLRKYL